MFLKDEGCHTKSYKGHCPDQLCTKFIEICSLDIFIPLKWESCNLYIGKFS